jgi:hypothetical protein
LTRQFAATSLDCIRVPLAWHGTETTNFLDPAWEPSAFRAGNFLGRGAHRVAVNEQY